MKKTEFLNGGIHKIEGMMINKSAPCWDKFRFISGAKSKDQTKFFMSGIHIEQAGNKTLIISTDGVRLHLASVDTLDIEPGDYEVKENTRDFMILYPMDGNIQYPNWKRIIKGLETQKHFSISLNSKDKQAFSKTLYQLYEATRTVINMEFIEPLAAVKLTQNEKWEVYFNGKKKAHTFINGDLMAIVMPMMEMETLKVEDTQQGPDFRDITPEARMIEFKPVKEKAAKKDRARKSE